MSNPDKISIEPVNSERKRFISLLLEAPFYEKCGFKRDYVVSNFFTDNYDRPIIEGGAKLTDMVYFTRDF